MYNEQLFFISIRKANKCLFSRRNGILGNIVFGYSIVIRLFGWEITRKPK